MTGSLSARRSEQMERPRPPRTGGLFHFKRNVSHWPVSSVIAAQANVGVQGNNGRAEESPNPTFLTRGGHDHLLTGVRSRNRSLTEPDLTL